MLIESIVISLIIGLLVRGRVKHLVSLDLRVPWILFMALGIEVLGGVLQKQGVIPVAGTTLWLHLSVYLFLLAFILANWHFEGVRVLALGTLLNFLVIIFNAGFMPVEVEVPLAMGFEEAKEALSQGMVFGHKVMAADDLLKSLGDIVHIPPPYPFPKTISFGDLLIGIGTGMLIVPHMKKKES